MLKHHRSYVCRITTLALLAAAAAACDQPGLTGPAASPEAAPSLTGAAGNLQYFGYVGGGDDDWSLAVTKAYTNFAHVWSRSSTTDPFVHTRVTAISQRGLKATIDLGRVFWCDYTGDDSFRFRCTDWLARWEQWKAFNASILTPDKVIALTVLDEPFKRGANMAHYDEVALRVKTDFPWAKLWLYEAACAVRAQCGHDPSHFSLYQGTLPSVDWITVGEYAIWPLQNAAYLSARDQMKARFPGKGWMYVMDGYWDNNLHRWQLMNPNYDRHGTMAVVARQWYDLARADPAAVLLGVFTWGPNSPWWMESMEFKCVALREHVAMGRAITGKTRVNSVQPVGRLERIDVDASGAFGTVVGWARDFDGALCEHPRVDIYAGGQFIGTAGFPDTPSYDRYWYDWTWTSPGYEVAWKFQLTFGSEWANQPITAVARDLDVGSTTLPSDCAENPACVWYQE
jgi:hypothetical protein